MGTIPHCEGRPPRENGNFSRGGGSVSKNSVRFFWLFSVACCRPVALLPCCPVACCRPFHVPPSCCRPSVRPSCCLLPPVVNCLVSLKTLKLYCIKIQGTLSLSLSKLLKQICTITKPISPYKFKPSKKLCPKMKKSLLKVCNSRNLDYIC